MSEQQIINYLLWMKERGQTVLVPNPVLEPQDLVIPTEDVQAPAVAIPAIETVPVAKEIELKVSVPRPEDVPAAVPTAPEKAPERIEIAVEVKVEVPAAIEEMTRAQYKVLFISLNALAAAEHEMVARIGAALKLESSDFAIAAGETAQKLFASSDAKAVVLMGEDAYPLVQARIHQTLLVISHPGAMLREPQLKVSAWDALQKLKATL